MTDRPLHSQDEFQRAHHELGGDSQYDRFVNNTEELERQIHGIPPAFQKVPVEGSVAPAVLSLRVNIETPLIWLNVSTLDPNNNNRHAGRGFGWSRPKLQSAFDFQGNLYFSSWEALSAARDNFALHYFGNFVIVRFRDESGAPVGVILAHPSGGVLPPQPVAAGGSFNWRCPNGKWAVGISLVLDCSKGNFVAKVLVCIALTFEM
ncbi:hypothetical protein AX16_002741 [Volvariella volvacea WC 439]|nr:hypothetical protein AX16_002741 [Volvariella volvacea WC 439]